MQLNYNSFKRWLYHDQRPNWIARILNRGWAIIHASGIAPNLFVTLEVVGRKSGKTVSFPLMLATVEGQRYLVSMLGDNTSWVRNVRAADGHAELVHGKREQIKLEEVPVEQRAPILKAYLRIAPGARPHIPVSKDAPVTEFEKIAADFPAFRIVADS